MNEDEVGTNTKVLVIAGFVFWTVQLNEKSVLNEITADVKLPNLLDAVLDRII